jgi:peptidoglycan/xylan/chitin deacetylase (PgdA/CDA1 family)
MYHSISDDVRDPWAVSKSAFTSQMEWLKRKRYNVVQLSEVVGSIMQNRNLRNCIALTFDDGYIDFLENAVPILGMNGFGATLFVPAGIVGGMSYWEPFEIRKRLLNWERLREVVQLGHSIGSHGMTHSDLTKLSPEEIVEEVGISKRKLEAELDISVDSFSYPFGRFSEREAVAVNKAAYSCAVTVHTRWGNNRETDLFRLERVAVSGKDSLADFEFKVASHKKVLRRCRDLLLGPTDALK